MVGCRDTMQHLHNPQQQQQQQQQRHHLLVLPSQNGCREAMVQHQ
jgi:hypothetical protein